MKRRSRKVYKRRSRKENRVSKRKISKRRKSRKVSKRKPRKVSKKNSRKRSRRKRKQKTLRSRPSSKKSVAHLHIVNFVPGKDKSIVMKTLRDRNPKHGDLVENVGGSGFRTQDVYVIKKNPLGRTLSLRCPISIIPLANTDILVMVFQLDPNFHQVIGSMPN